MKTQDFLTSLGNINEKYVRQLLEEDFVPAGSAVSADRNISGTAASVQLTSSGETSIKQPEAKHSVSGIMRYLVLGASAAACVGGVFLFIKMNQKNPNDLVKDSVPPEMTEITAITTTTMETTLTTRTVPDATETTDTTSKLVFTEDTTTVSVISTEEISILTITATEETTEQTTQSQSVSQTDETTIAAQSSSETTVTTVSTEEQQPVQTTPEGLSNSIQISCIDFITGEPLAGVEISLIETPSENPKQVASWVSDSTGIHMFAGLTKAGYDLNPAYVVRVESIPEGYVGGYEAPVRLEELSGNTVEITYCFVDKNASQTMPVNVIDHDTGEFVNDIAPYSVWSIDSSGQTHDIRIYWNIMPGEPISLPDGTYFMMLDSSRAEKKGYQRIASNSGFSPNSFCIDFTVTNGIPDKELVFYAEKTAFALHGGPAFEASLTEPQTN